MNESPRRDWIVLALVIVAGVVFGMFQNQARAKGRADLVTSLLSNAMMPIVAPLNRLGASSTDFWNGVRDAQQLRVENRRLRDKVLALGMYQETLDRYQQQIEELQGDLGIEAPGKTKLAANIVAYSPFENQFTIDKGSNQGVKENQPVVTGKGLIGIVSAVDKQKSQVLLLTAASVSLSGIIQTEPVKVAGIIQRPLGGRLIMKVFDNTEIPAGAEVTTAGYSSTIPRGILIGTVIEVTKDQQYGETRAQILPSAKISDVSEVIVLK